MALPASPFTPTQTPRALSPPKRPATPSEYLSSPIKHSANAHPYLIHSSSTSILTRTNSSPSKPIEAVRYRPSRSMSSLHGVADAAVESPSKVEEGEVWKERRRATPRRIVKSSSISSLSSAYESVPNLRKEAGRPELPSDPKTWSASDLAQYLIWTLDQPDHLSTEKIPSPLIDDITSWIFRCRISGRTFLRLNAETIANTTNPPPFLPLLLSIARRLKRASMQVGELPSIHRKDVSVFQESEESGNYDEDGLDGQVGDEKTNGVKRLARAYETRSTKNEVAVEKEMDRGQKGIDPQWTGSSSSSAVWEKWGIKKQHTGSSSISSVSSEAREVSSLPLPTTLPVEEPTSSAKVSAPGSHPFVFSPPPPYLTTLIPFAGGSSAFSGLSPEPENPSFDQKVTEAAFSHESVQAHIRDQLESYKTLRRLALPAPSAVIEGLHGLSRGEGSTVGGDEDQGDIEFGGNVRRVTLRPSPTKTQTVVTRLSVETMGDTDFGPAVPASQVDLEEVYRRLDSLERQLAAREPYTAPQTYAGSESFPGNVLEPLWEALDRLPSGDVGDLIGLPGILFVAGIGLGIVTGAFIGRRR